MKQISYLTMFFLLASFAAVRPLPRNIPKNYMPTNTPPQAVFGMKMKEITPDTRGTISHYLAFALPTTAVTIWIIMAFQYRKKDPRHVVHEDSEHEAEPRFSWPVEGARRWRRRWADKLRGREQKTGEERSARSRSRSQSRSESARAAKAFVEGTP
jgi:hypothetical protein